MKLQIRNWETFQHYRERRPPWIKLHTEILDEFDHEGEPKKFRNLPDHAKLTFLMLLALASRYKGGVIPSDDPPWIARETGLDARTVCLPPLIECGYLGRGASGALAGCKRDAPKVLGSEREGETERDTHTPAREGLPGLIDQIRTARHGYADEMSEQDVASALHAVSGIEYRPVLEKAVADWCATQANLAYSEKKPIYSVRDMCRQVAATKPCCMEDAAPNWRAAWKTRFRWPVKDDAAKQIEAKLNAEYPDWTPASLIAALDVISEAQRSSVKGPREPVLGEILDAMRLSGAKGRGEAHADSAEIAALKAGIRAADTYKARIEIAKTAKRAADVQALIAYADGLKRATRPVAGRTGAGGYADTENARSGQDGCKAAAE